MTSPFEAANSPVTAAGLTLIHFDQIITPCPVKSLWREKLHQGARVCLYVCTHTHTHTQTGRTGEGQDRHIARPGLYRSTVSETYYKCCCYKICTKVNIIKWKITSSAFNVLGRCVARFCHVMAIELLYVCYIRIYIYFYFFLFLFPALLIKITRSSDLLC